ncbi:MAG: SusD/RagB family nutrient-binding outer membrane lipoprotein [Runella sp.]
MKKGLIISLALFLSIGFTSCEKYLDVNFDPKFPQVSQGFAILPPMIAQMSRAEAFDGRFTGQYCQYWLATAAGNVWDRHGYAAGSDAGGEFWRSHYWSIGKNVDLIIEDATSKQQWDYVGVAKAIRAWGWQSTTDVNGEMILRQAWEPNRYVFDFDPQEDVYKEVVRLCNEALADLNRTDGNVSAASLGRGDLVYQGDRTKWIRFVNAILARNAHHLTNKRSYNPDAVIRFVDASFASNADNFNIPHTNASNTEANFWGPLRNNMNAYRQSNYLVNVLNGSILGGPVDPRLAAMLTASDDRVFRGVNVNAGDPNNVAGRTNRVANFWGQTQPTATPPTTGKFIFQDATMHPLITYSELQFIKAEAAFIKGDRNMAYDAYLKGINAHLDWVLTFVTDATARTQFTTERTAYMRGAGVAQTAAALTLSDIMMQKWIAMFVHGHNESWMDMRRYRYSSEIYRGFAPPSGLTIFPDNNGKLVYRLRPRFNSEYVWNRASLATFGGLDPDFHTKETWAILP